MAPDGAYLFLLGLLSGVAVLAISAYRHVSPPWLKWLLIGSGIFVIGRHATSALTSQSPETWFQVRILRYVGMANSLGLTLPGVFAVDQVIRHPAMTPNKLLRWYAPFLMVYGVTLLSETVLLEIVEAIFFVGFAGVCLMLWRRIPLPPIRRALLGLILTYGSLGLVVLGVTFAHWSGRTYLYAEMAVLLALWHAYETAFALRQAG